MTDDTLANLNLPIPKSWIDEIDRLRGDRPRVGFIRDCIRSKIGRKKFPPVRGRGRPAAND